MALINCPECNKEISDNAKNCPHCGYSINVETIKTELGSVQKNSTLGIILIISGIFAILIGIPMIGIVIGIFTIIGGLAFIGIGTSKLQGTQNGTCPYCNNTLQVRYKEVTVKCSYCKKISNKTDKYLEKID